MTNEELVNYFDVQLFLPDLQAKTKDELAKLTLKLIESQDLMAKLSEQAIKDSRKFSKEVFCRKINELVKKQ